MHPEFLQMTIHDHNRDLDRRARAAFVGQAGPTPAAQNEDAVELRLCRVDDDPALERLACSRAGLLRPGGMSWRRSRAR